MTALEQPSSITIAEYLKDEELSDAKHEYLGGTVHAMAGASNRHNPIAGNALGFLLAKLRRKSCRPFNSGTKVRIEYPDHTRFITRTRWWCVIRIHPPIISRTTRWWSLRFSAIPRGERTWVKSAMLI